MIILTLSMNFYKWATHNTCSAELMYHLFQAAKFIYDSKDSISIGI